MAHKEVILSKANRTYILGFVGIILALSIVLNVVQYVSGSQLFANPGAV